jgi:hypothetical protein
MNFPRCIKEFTIMIKYIQLIDNGKPRLVLFVDDYYQYNYVDIFKLPAAVFDIQDIPYKLEANYHIPSFNEVFQIILDIESKIR